MVRIGIIGLGFGRFVQIPGFQQIRNAHVFGVVSQSEQQSAVVAAKYGIERTFSHWRELIECDDIQAVSIATPPPMHEEMAIEAFRRGKSVLCEKPLAMTGNQAKRMCEAAEESGCVHMVDFEFHEIPAWKYAKQILDEGGLGEIRHAEINWIVSTWSDCLRPWSWKADRKSGGGILTALGIHVIDYIEWLLAPIISVVAQPFIKIVARPDNHGKPRGVDAPDVCNMMLELSGNIPVSVSLSAIARLGRGHRIVIYGEKDTLVIANRAEDDYGDGFKLWRSDPENKKYVQQPLPKNWEKTTSGRSGDGRVAHFTSLAKRFVNAVECGSRGDSLVPNFHHGMRAQFILDALYESDRRRGWIETPLKPYGRGL